MLGDPHRLPARAGGRAQGKLIGGAQALYWDRPSPGQLEREGLAPEDYASPEQKQTSIYYDAGAKDWFFDVWDENWPAIDLYLQLQTQWRVGIGGPYGLDYNVVFHELDRRDLDRETYDDLMDSIRTIEETALKHFSKK